MNKHTHVLIINKLSKDSVVYTYDFGNTKNIKLTISKTGVSISANLSNIYDKKEMLSSDGYLFPDSIKKALLLYLLKYNKTLSIKSITVKIDDVEEVVSFDNKTTPPIYSMINGGLKRNISEDFSSNSVFEHLLKTPKSKYDKRIAALFAFLCSKSKEYETERFIYLWTSFNGMYSWISEFIAKANGVDRYRRENKQIIAFQKYIDVGYETIEDGQKSIIANSVISILKEIDVEHISKTTIDENELSERISCVLNKASGKKYNLNTYGYLLTQLSYYFRCKIVHGSKPVLLFSYADDGELHSLKVINALLEEFVDKNLPFWLDEKYITDTIIPKTEEIKLK